MKRSEKVKLVENLIPLLSSAKSIILTDITGIRVNDQNRLRRMMREVDAKLLVVKNTLLSRALNQISNFKFPHSKDSGQAILNLQSSLSGQTAIIVSQTNEVEPVQALGKIIRELDMPKLKVGVISGNIYDESALVRISKLPGREVLSAQVVGTLASPLSNLIGTLQGNLQKLLFILNIRAQGGETK